MRPVSQQTLQRLPIYLSYIKSLLPNLPSNISAGSIAQALGFGEVQVRKDLAAVSGGGRPKLGFVTVDLMADIKHYLGCDNIDDAVLVGAGKLGKALLAYDGFIEYGLDIVAAFDADPGVIGENISKKKVYSPDDLRDYCKDNNIRVGIITVPADQAQTVCDRLIEAGILAIWNFAPVHLKTPDPILIRNENLAASLAILSKHLVETFTK
ncbi:MAG: redox-sensing transcriptional repressor Rex [Eubacteriales bacterium]|nr:redox-sensing transcriptional repressor Rex [Eubacteriales bacterium]